MKIARKSSSVQVEAVSPALCDRLDSLNPRELEQLAIDAILENRCRLGVAERAFEEFASLVEGAEGLEAYRDAYAKALAASRVQMAFVAVVVEKLGYVPNGLPPVN